MRKEKQFHFIYKTTNILSGKYYIGMHSTNNLNDGYLGSGRRLRYSINKYGKENHKREIIEFVKNRKELKLREKYYVTLNEVKDDMCYNAVVGGGGWARLGTTTSNETKLKMSNTMMGHKTSDETKRKIREALKGYVFTDERKQNISKGRRGITSFKGKKHSEESLKKMSLAQKGVPKPKVKCPHCEKIGGYPQMKQYHFEKCKNYK